MSMLHHRSQKLRRAAGRSLCITLQKQDREHMMHQQWAMQEQAYNSGCIIPLPAQHRKMILSMALVLAANVQL